MNTIQKISILLILPVVLFILSSLFQSELYIVNLYDPSYVYLINSLNLIQFEGYGVGHIDHPGTPVQMIGAIVTYTVHLFSGKNDIVTDVFNRPEFYLSSIFLTLIFLNSAVLFVLGIVAYKKLKNIYFAVFCN